MSFPCKGKGWSWPNSHCQPPAGQNSEGHSCSECPHKKLEENLAKDDLRTYRKGDRLKRSKWKRYFKGPLPCGAPHPENPMVTCTREKGHKGRHMATICHQLIQDPWRGPRTMYNPVTGKKYSAAVRKHSDGPVRSLWDRKDDQEATA